MTDTLKLHPEDSGDPLKHFRYTDDLTRLGFHKICIYGAGGRKGAGEEVGLYTVGPNRELFHNKQEKYFEGGYECGEYGPNTRNI